MVKFPKKEKKKKILRERFIMKLDLKWMTLNRLFFFFLSSIKVV